MDPRGRFSAADEHSLVLAGYLAFADPPSPDAAASVVAMKRDGVDVKILTGDNELVARHVCEQVGIQNPGVMLGEELESTSDTALEHRAEETTIFARVSPMQKHRIIHALKRRGHVVGYMGDGINDAPSLHAADVGISVASAVDVARDAADIILLKPGLGVLHSGIIEGRRASANVLKYLFMGTSSNFGNMFSMAAASVFLPFLPMLPTQILLNNFLYDASQLTIPSDNVDEEYMRRPRPWDMKMVRNFMLTIGPISSIYDFLTFYVLLAFFPRQPAGISHRLVCRISGHADACDFCHPHDGKSTEEPTQPALGNHDYHDRSHRHRPSLFSLYQAVRIRSAAGPVLCVSGHLNRDLPRTGRVGQAHAAPGMTNSD